MMQQGFRGGLPPMGGLPGGLQGGFGGAAPTANLFSSIPGLNDATMLGAAAPATTAGPASGADPDSGDSSGGGGGRGKKSAEQRAAAVQEKNRRAQKRFRERQVRCSHCMRAAGGMPVPACLCRLPDGSLRIPPPTCWGWCMQRSHLLALPVSDSKMPFAAPYAESGCSLNLARWGRPILPARCRKPR